MSVPVEDLAALAARRRGCWREKRFIGEELGQAIGMITRRLCLRRGGHAHVVIVSPTCLLAIVEVYRGHLQGLTDAIRIVAAKHGRRHFGWPLHEGVFVPRVLTQSLSSPEEVAHARTMIARCAGL